MGRPLVIIEAPGKVATLAALLEHTPLENARLFATQGRLFDLEADTLGLDPDTLEPLYALSLHPKRIEQLEALLRETSEVFLATDNDSEGELIAAHAVRIIAKHRPELTCHRLRPQHMTRASWLSALKTPEPLDAHRVQTAQSRRALDRLLGYGFGAKGDSPRLSRIQIPALAHLHSKDAPAAWQLFHEAAIPAAPGVAWLSLGLPAGQGQAAESLYSKLAGLPPPQLLLVSEVQGQFQPPLLTGPETLLLVAEATDMSVTEVDVELQRLYEQGDISYHRTDSTQLSAERERALQQMAQFYGVHRDKQGGLQEAAQREPGLEGAHEALTPLEKGPDRASPLDSLPPADQCMAVLRDITLRAVGGTIATSTHEYRLDMNSPQNSLWIQALPAEAPHFRWRAVLQQQARYRLPAEKPTERFGRKLSCQRHAHTTLRRVPDDQRALDALIQLGLGRPSTAAFHARRLAEDALEATGELKPSQLQRLVDARSISPLLLDAQAAQAAEARLYQDGSLAARVQDAAALLGIQHDVLESARRPLPPPAFPRSGFTPGRDQQLPMDN